MPLPSVVSPSRTSQPEKGLFLIKMTFFFFFPLPSCFLWLQLRAVLHPMTQPKRGCSLSPTLRDCFRPGLCRSSELLLEYCLHGSPMGSPIAGVCQGLSPASMNCSFSERGCCVWVANLALQVCVIFLFPFLFPVWGYHKHLSDFWVFLLLLLGMFDQDPVLD